MLTLTTSCRHPLAVGMKSTLGRLLGPGDRVWAPTSVQPSKRSPSATLTLRRTRQRRCEAARSFETDTVHRLWTTGG